MAQKPDPNQTVRIPLVGSHNTRIVASNVPFTASGIIGIGVIGIMIIGNTTASGKDQRFVNAIPDKVTNPLTGKEKFYVFKRPGIETHTTPQSGSVGTAIRIWTGQGSGDKIISAFGAVNSTIYDGVVSLGNLVGAARDITETTVGTTATLVIPVENSKAYFYPDAGALTEIVDVDYPGAAGLTTAGTFVHLDGYSFIMTTDGQVWNSDLNSIISWSSTSFLSANMYPDKGVGLARYKEFIVAFGRESLEFFKVVGNPLGSPLQRVNEGFYKLGALSSTAICPFEDNVAFVASSDIGNISVYIIDSGKPQRISTEAIDVQLSVRGSNSIYMTSAKIFGKTLIYVMAGSLTFVYCIEDKIWHEWSGNTIKWSRFTANSAVSQTLYSISRDSTDGKIYKINPVSTVYQDDGNTYTMFIQTSKVDMDSEKRKFLSRLTIVGDVNTAASTLNISWSDDDYATFSNSRTVDLTSQRKYLTACGSFRRRAFRITNSDAVPVRLEGLELDFKEGTH